MKIHLIMVSEVRSFIDHSNKSKFDFVDADDRRKFFACVPMDSADFDVRKRWYDLLCGFVASHRMNQEIWIEIEEPLIGDELDIKLDFTIEVRDRRPSHFTPRDYRAKPESNRKDLQ